MRSTVRTEVVLLTAISVLLAWAGCAARQVIRVSGPPIPRIVPERAWESGGTDVTLRGAPQFQFVPPVRVFFGEAEGKVLAADPRRGWVRIRVPAHAPGAVRIRVVIGAGRDTAQEFFATPDFEYMPRARVTSIMPRRVDTEGGTTVTVVGSGFHTGIGAAIGGQVITGFERLSENQLFLVMPSRPAGPVAITVTNLPGTPLEDRLVVPGFEYVAPRFRYRLAVTARLIDVSTTRVLKGGLFEGTADLGSSPDGSVDEAFDAATARLLDSFYPRRPSAVDGRTQIVSVSDAPWRRAPSNHVDAMARFGPALARALTEAGVKALDQLEIAPGDGDDSMAFYIDPLGAAGYAALESDPRVNTILEYRIATAGVQDLRDLQRYQSEPAGPSVDEVDSAADLFERYRELASTLPTQDSTSGTIVVRFPPQTGLDAGLGADDRVIEDGIVAGLSRRATVLQKLGGPVVKPDWISRQVANLPNPLAYSSWDHFRRSDDRVAVVFLYRPVGSGIYGRFVDTSTGRVLWSDRLYPGADILGPRAGAGIYERADALLAKPRWDLRIGLGARVAVLRLQAAAAPSELATAAQDALISTLVASGITLIDPLLNLYEPQEPPAWRTDLSGSPDIAPDWTAFQHVGATHVLEHVPTADVAGDVLTSWEFRLRDAATGKIVSSWVLRPLSARSRTSTRHATP